MASTPALVLVREELPEPRLEAPSLLVFVVLMVPEWASRLLHVCAIPVHLRPEFFAGVSQSRALQRA